MSSCTCKIFVITRQQERLFIIYIFVTGRMGSMGAMQELKVKDREERSKIVLWKMPFTTMRYFLLECFVKLLRLFHQYVLYYMLISVKLNRYECVN